MDVFVTGGAGFLGRALMRDADSGISFTCYSRDEHKLRDVEARYGARTIAGDVTDYERLKLAMAGHRYVVHAAATKYVDRGETHPFDVARTNVGGTVNVLTAAAAVGVSRVVIISTDKAVHPANAYGLSKALDEYLALRSSSEATVARYGNVLRSTGSVVERWLALPENEKLAVTNPDMTRFWMTCREAARLVWQALFDAPPYSVVIPVLKSSTILNLAHACVGVPRIEVVGERLGEKQHEELLSEEELPYASWEDGGPIILRPPHARGTPVSRHSGHGPGIPPAQRSDTAERWITSELAAAIRLPLP